MRIAYYEENNYHTEIMGTFLEPFKNSDEIVVYNNQDKSGYVEMFNEKINFIVKNTDLLLDEINSFDIVIIGTSTSFKFVDNEKINFMGTKPKIVFISHLKNDTDKFKDYNGVVLTPINIIGNLKYILPINNFFLDKNKTYDKIRICIIGRFKDSNRNINDIIKLLLEYPNLNYEIIIYSRHIKFVPKHLFTIQRFYKDKIKINLDVPISKIIKSIGNINYFCPLSSSKSCYSEDRLTGIIPFSFNYNTPLLLDENTNNIYNLKSSIIYKKSLCEIIESLCNKTIEEYNGIVSNTIDEKKIILNNNLNVLNDIFNITNY